MSRCYRIRQTVKVRDSISRDVCSSDEISTELEMLDILPADQMGALLRQELLNRGFEERDQLLTRSRDGIEISIDPNTGTVTIRIHETAKVEVGGVKEVNVVNTPTEREQERLREQLREELQERLDEAAADHSRRVSQAMEARLGDISAELDHVVNRVTAEALKQKAAQMGTIKEIADDAETGSLTIKVEV